MPDSTNSGTDRIIGWSLITAETLAQDLRELIAKELARDWHRPAQVGYHVLGVVMMILPSHA